MDESNYQPRQYDKRSGFEDSGAPERLRQSYNVHGLPLSLGMPNRLLVQFHQNFCFNSTSIFAMNGGQSLDRPGRRKAACGWHGAMIAAERTSGHARLSTRSSMKRPLPVKTTWRTMHDGAGARLRIPLPLQGPCNGRCPRH
jgi:hypothetical protein